jgi:transposase
MNDASKPGEMAEGKEQFWRRELESWRQSGLRQAEYQRKHGLTKNAFTYWKLKLLGSSRNEATLVAVPRRVVRAAKELGSGGGIRLRLTGGYVVELGQDFPTRTLDRLLTVLERRGG